MGALLSGFLSVLAFLGASLGCAALAEAFTVAGTPGFRPLEGLLLAVLAAVPLRLAPAVAVGGGAMQWAAGTWVAGRGAQLAAFDALGVVLAAAAGSVVLRSGSPRPLQPRVREVVLGAVAATLVSAPIAASFAAAAQAVSASGSLGTWMRAWAASATGGAIMLPFAAAVIAMGATPGRMPWSRSRVVEFALMLASLATAATLLFGLQVLPAVPPSALHVALVWAAVRFGVPGAAAASLVLAILVVGHTLAGRGPYAHVDADDSLAMAQVYLLLSALVFQVLASALADRARAERALRMANIELERRVARRTAELTASNARLRDREARLRDADRRKNDFLAMLAHELRNPLAPIRNAIAVLRLAPGDSQRVGWAAALVERQVAQMVRLIDDLLDVSRLQRGTILLQRARLDLAQVARDVADGLMPQLQSGGRRFVLSLPAAPVVVDGDATRLAQVLSNLLGNATKFTPHDGCIELSVATEPGPDGQPEAVVRVCDDGSGIAAEVLPHVFELFVQGEQPVEQRSGGLGIGLMLVRRLVEMHGGRVQADSAGPGQGATFTVWLPLADAPAAAPTAEPAEAPVGEPAQAPTGEPAEAPTREPMEAPTGGARLP